jgi:phage terminase large subunit GpA-like protein
MTLEIDYPLGDAESVVASAWADAWSVPPALRVSEWAAAHRYLTAQASNERGRWLNERHPMLVEIMDVLSEDDPHERVVVRKPTQWGGTEVLLNALGYFMCHAEPSPILLVVPGLDMARKHSKQRIAPSIAASPEWSRCVPPARSRDSSNSTMEKEFRGEGIMIIATANSSTGLRAMPVRFLLGDEVSKWKRDLDGEGSALEQAEGRTSSYQGRRKILLISSPTIVGDCTISEEIEASDMREYHVPCPHCRALDTWKFENLTADGKLLCTACGQLYGEASKTWCMDPANGARWIPRFPGRAAAGFDGNALYAPYRLGDSWVSLAEQRARALKNPERMVAFTQMKMARPFAGERERADETAMKSRAELGLRVGHVPNGYYILTAGVDCQADRFAIKVIAWGPGERGVIVQYEEIPGDPSAQEGYAELDKYLLRNYPKGSLRLVPRCVAIDGGNWTEEVAKFVRTRQRRMVATGAGYADQFIVLVRGRSTDTGRVVNRPRKTEATWRGKTIARSVGMWGVGTDIAKNILFGRIAADAKAESIDERNIRFPGGVEVKVGERTEVRDALSDDYFHQLTTEYFDKTAKRWIHDKALGRNEAIDTMVYAYFAALHPHVRLDLIKQHEWDALRESQEKRARDLFDAENSTTGNVPHETVDAEKEGSVIAVARRESSAVKPRRGSGGFATSW